MIALGLETEVFSGGGRCGASLCGEGERQPAGAGCGGQVLGAAGMEAAQPAMLPQQLPGHLPVMLDGRVLGTVAAAVAPQLVARLRAIKAARLAASDPAASAAAAGRPQLRLEVRACLARLHQRCAWKLSDELRRRWFPAEQHSQDNGSQSGWQ